MDSDRSCPDATPTERGVAVGAYYELYDIPQAGGFLLYDVTGGATTLAPQGQAVKSWIAAHRSL